MKVFVTGATGFLGSVLVRQLLSAGHQVKAIKRPTSKLDLLGQSAEQVEWLEGEVGDIDSLISGMEGTDGTFHCAAYLGFDGEFSRDLLMEVNVAGTANVVNASLEFENRRLVHISSIAALGRSDQMSGELNEAVEWVNSPMNTAYAVSKHLAEMEIYRGISEGLDAVIVNPSLVMGPGRKGENTMQIAEKLLSRSIPFIPKGGTNVVDVEDVASGAISAYHQGACVERYILSGHNMKWTEIMADLATPLGVPAPSRIVSPSVLKAFSYLSEGWATLSRTKPLINRETARLASSLSFYSNAKASKELKFVARPFSETAARIASAALMLLLVFVIGCSGGSPPLNERSIVTTLPVLHLILEPIASEYSFEVLLPDGQSPHGFQVSPSQARRLSEARLLVYAHPEIDGWASSLSPESSFTLWTDSATEDAHFWTDPVMASEAARRFADKLCEINQSEYALYRRRSIAFSVRVDSVSNSIGSELSSLQNECFVVAHSFMTQFLDRFGITSIGPIQPLPGHDSSPRTLAEMMNKAKTSGCRTLLVQKTVDNRSMESLAKDLGVRMVVVDPLGSEQVTYEAYLSALSQALLYSAE